MKNLKKWFTLVELIVVITILAILGTIAFISLQGYSADARNSKRTSDINSISSQVNIKSTEGVSFLAMVSYQTGSSIASYGSIAGTGVTANTTGTNNYTAGSPVGTALGMKIEEFQDPNGDSYVIGATTKKEGKYEIAASVEIGGGTEVAQVIGNYVARSVDAVGLTDTGSSLIGSIAATDVGKLVYGDTVKETAGTATGTVTAVSGDGASVTVSFTATSNTDTVELMAAETLSLIDVAGTTNTGAVTDGWANLPY